MISTQLTNASNIRSSKDLGRNPTPVHRVGLQPQTYDSPANKPQTLINHEIQIDFLLTASHRKPETPFASQNLNTSFIFSTTAGCLKFKSGCYRGGNVRKVFEWKSQKVSNLLFGELMEIVLLTLIAPCPSTSVEHGNPIIGW